MGYTSRAFIFIAIALFFLSLTQSAAAQTYQWRLAMSWPEGTPMLHNGVKRFASNIEKMSAGRMRIIVDAPGRHKAPLGIFDMVRSGIYEMGHTASYYYKGKDPATTFFTTTPFGMNPTEMNAWYYYGGGLELLNEVYARHNIVAFPAGNTHLQMGGWFRKEINSIEDLKGLKMRIPGHAGEVVGRTGMKPVSVPPGELYTSLERGTIDAVEWAGPANDEKLGFHKIAPFYYTGWHEPGAELHVFINKDKFDVLPEDLRTIIAIAAKEVSFDMLAESFFRNTIVWEEMKKKGDIKIRTFPKDVLEAFRQANNELLIEAAEKSTFAKKVIESQREFLSKAKDWSKITDEDYLRLR
ncbi:TRAP transporter substrate-binding protein [Nitrosomonas sp. Nm166]|uniref:TRAP transporter substrate-binding protein n=1 Tax=Nitrosomonas sp. Nm166 TaxID=1881054 RepID=UPI0008F2B441|nr:TRAP transporter substrate-binding protein [Nitrosomonas sp. Nm166]SFD84948.1 TRAP-type mannitol/chloroaromatic compound transport system, substrate-binding protein [Nitrosomonas sp. Nm166]